MTLRHDNPAYSIFSIDQIKRVAVIEPRIKEKLKYQISSLENLNTELSRRRRRRRKFFLYVFGLIGDFSITDSKVNADKIDDLYVAEKGKTVDYEVTYKNNRGKPALALVEQKANEVKDEVEVLFGRYAEYKRVTKIEITQTPFKLDCEAKIVNPRTKAEYDVITETYNFVVFDDSVKPLSEYPVPNATNVELDLAYNFQDGNSYAYPSEAETLGITLTNISPTFNNFVVYNNKRYVRPDRGNSVTLNYEIRNNSDYILNAISSGMLLSVIYEDYIHVSQILSGSTDSYQIGRGSAMSLSDTITLPSWAYGMIQICKVFDFYDYDTNSYLITAGAVHDFKVGRVVFP